jgi:hypothetical protein
MWIDLICPEVLLLCSGSYAMFTLPPRFVCAGAVCDAIDDDSPALTQRRTLLVITATFTFPDHLLDN